MASIDEQLQDRIKVHQEAIDDLTAPVLTDKVEEKTRRELREERKNSSENT